MRQARRAPRLGCRPFHHVVKRPTKSCSSLQFAVVPTGVISCRMGYLKCDESVMTGAHTEEVFPFRLSDLCLTALRCLLWERSRQHRQGEYFERSA